MSLFRRKKLKEGIEVDPETDEGVIGLFYSILGEVIDDFTGATAGHLERLHEPGGIAREKAQKDFMDLGMTRSYIDALDDIEFNVDSSIAVPGLPVGARGKAAVVTRWTARGTQNRPLEGLAPTGEPVTVEGITYTVFRNFNIRSDYTYWHVAELTRRMLER